MVKRSDMSGPFQQSSVLTGTKHIVGQATASWIASTASVLPRLTEGYCINLWHHLCCVSKNSNRQRLVMQPVIHFHTRKTCRKNIEKSEKISLRRGL